MEKDFVHYILNNKLLSKEIVLKAMEIQKKRIATPIGEIATRLSMLTPEQVGTILNAQTYENKMFGEIAVKLGLLKEKDIDKLLNAQKRLRAPIIKILAEMNSAPPKTLTMWYMDYQKSITTIKYSCGKCSVSITKEQWDSGIKSCPECGGMLALKAEKGDMENLALELNPELKKIFIVTSQRCPVCGIDDDQLYISNSAFSTKNNLLDLMPEYRWIDNNYSSYHINAFNAWQCQNCGYTAIREYYEDPVQDSSLTQQSFRNAVYNFLRNDETASRIISFLKEKNTFENTGLASALKRLLIAAFFLENVEKIKNKDSISIGRTYLRLSWIYREIEALPEQEKDKAISELKDTFSAFGDIWKDYPRNEKDAVGKSIGYYEDAIYQSQLPEQKETEHSILQIIGLLYLKQGDTKKSRSSLHEAAAKARTLKEKIIREIQDIHKLPPSQGKNTYEHITALKKKNARLDRFLAEISNQLEEASNN
ncbi:MAG: hypothetical protein A2020_05345 [Lentisphaerae bacterium GWF2_45_14]|nr:MAG: hypothetical protein A2020_05345 [Lentisphaerae bacterium GWF2_45_14]